MNDRKKTVSVLLSRMKPDGTSSEAPAKPELELDDADASLKSLAEQVMIAFKNESAHDLMLALKAFVAESIEPDADQEEVPA